MPQNAPYRVEIPGVGVVEFPPGTPQSVIQAESRRLYEQRQQSPESPAGESPKGSGLLDRVIESLPEVGGFAGSLIGAGKWNPLGMAGAAIGGAGGEGVRQIAQAVRGNFDAVPDSLVGQIKAMLGEGAEQGSFEGIGRGAMRVVGSGARRLYNAALAPTPTLRREFPKLIDTGLRERIVASRGGAAKADRLVTESSDAADAAIRAAQKAGGDGVRPRELTRGMGKVKRTAQARVALGSPNAAKQVEEVRERARQIAGAHTTPAKPAVPPTVVTTPETPDAIDAAIRANTEIGPLAALIPDSIFASAPAQEVKAARQMGATANALPRNLFGRSQSGSRTFEFGGEPAVAATERRIPLTRAQELKREAQNLARTAYRTQERGGVVNDIQMSLNEAIAKAAREAIERRAPEVAPLNARTQELIGVERALGEQANRGIQDRWPTMLTQQGGLGVLATLASGGNLPLGAAVALGSTPRNLSAAAIGLNETAKFAEPKAGNLLRVIEAILGPQNLADRILQRDEQ
jgi:hypothetical protein